MYVQSPVMSIFTRPSPHGEGGLKYKGFAFHVFNLQSLPAWGGWIEMHECGTLETVNGSLPAWGGWIEMQ